jgi:hypothetical protein
MAATQPSFLDKTGGVVVLSYGWLSANHPDPLGWHMQTVRRYLLKHVNWNFGNNSVRCQQEVCGHDIGFFWDFASLPQNGPDGTKSQEDKLVFEVGLSVINLLYGLKRTIVIQLKAMPEPFVVPGGGKANLTPYAKRGWCIFEESVSGVLKDADRLLNLELAYMQLNDPIANFRDVRFAAVLDRKPPCPITVMAETLNNATFTSGEVDRKKVTDLYNNFFAEAAAAVEGRLFLSNRGCDGGWCDQEALILAEALPAFSVCQVVDLDGHSNLREEGLFALQGPLLEMPRLDKCILPRHLECTAAGAAFRKAWARAGKSGNKLLWLTKGQGNKMSI